MKSHVIPVFLVAALLTGAGTGWAGRAEKDPTREPGYFDFGDIARYADGDETVEISLAQPILSLVEAVIKKDQPELSNMITDLLLVKVDAFSYEPSDRNSLEKDVDQISTRLNGGGWQRLVKVKDNEERVFLYVKPSTEGSGGEEHDIISGLVVVVLGAQDDEDEGDMEEAVFVNVVGNFDMLAISELIEHFEVPHMNRKDLEEMGRQFEKMGIEVNREEH